MQNTQQLAQQGMAALQSGNAQKAKQCFEKIVNSGQANASTWLALAFSCGNLRDNEAALNAVNKCLEKEPRNLRGLMFKADHLSQMGGRKKDALTFYNGAIQVAATMRQIPQDMIPPLNNAKRISDQALAEQQSFLISRLKELGYNEEHKNKRFEASLDIAFGKKTIYHQEPNVYYFPGLAPIQFFEREEFPWVEQLEAGTDEIRIELANILDKGPAFAPYIQSDENSLQFNDKTSLDSQDWTAFYLYKDGKKVEGNTELCPNTMRILECIPSPKIIGRAPTILFSKLKSGARIPPHTGLLNTRLICHLPLNVPVNCGALRCGNEERSWEEGKVLIFDDSIEHEAWNESDEERIVLIFEIWRPDLNDQERKMVSAMLQAILEI